MRQALKTIGKEERHVFYGTFERYGTKTGYKGMLKTVLLIDIKNEDKQVVTNHLWFNFTKGFEKLNLQKGDKVKFNGRVQSYVKGYFGRRMDVYAPIELDYQIKYPTKISIVERKQKIDSETTESTSLLSINNQNTQSCANVF